MIKKVVISAAGRGTRMLELTRNRSKHLIEVEQRPFLAYLMDNILEAGYKEIILVTGFREDLVKEFLRSYEYSGAKIAMVNQFSVLGPKEKEYGTACPIKCVKDLVKDEPFISLCGDNFYSANDLRLMNIDDGFTYVAGIENEHPEHYGVLVADNGRLKEIIEKPETFVGNLINTSLYTFTREVYDVLPLIKQSPRGEYEITDAVSLLAARGKVKVRKLNDFWMDFGRPEDVQKFSAFIKNGVATAK